MSSIYKLIKSPLRRLRRKFNKPPPPVDREKEKAEQKQLALELREEFQAAEKTTRNCLVCEGSQFSQIAQQDRHEIGISTVICNVCGFLMTQPQPSQEFIDRFYQRYYWDLYFGASSKNENSLNYWRKQGVDFVQSISSTLDFSNVESILEIGCGAGYTLKEFIKQFPRKDVYAIEPSMEEAKQLAREIGDSKVVCASLETAKGAELVRIPSSLDFIYSTHVLEHAYDPLSFLEYLRQASDIGSHVYLETPDIFYTSWRFPNMFHLGHLWHFSEESLTYLLAKYGFQRRATLRGVGSSMKPSGVGILAQRVKELDEEVPIPNIVDRVQSHLGPILGL